MNAEAAATNVQNGDDVNPVVDRLQSSLDVARGSGESIGLLLVHSAAVYRIDALHGFDAGDRMSGNIALLLRSKAMRRRDLLDPLSRDEFVCVLRPAPRRVRGCRSPRAPRS